MMQNKVIDLISKPPGNRSSIEIRDVLPWLRKKSDLLSTSKNGKLITLTIWVKLPFFIFRIWNMIKISNISDLNLSSPIELPLADSVAHDQHAHARSLTWELHCPLICRIGFHWLTSRQCSSQVRLHSERPPLHFQETVIFYKVCYSAPSSWRLADNSKLVLTLAWMN